MKLSCSTRSDRTRISRRRVPPATGTPAQQTRRSPRTGRGLTPPREAGQPDSPIDDASLPWFSMIAAISLTKRYGDTTAVRDLSFDVHPGVVTGFLGPNGSGKSTTMRMIMGLDVPTSGSALINGKSYEELRWPLREVGALLDAKAFHP